MRPKKAVATGGQRQEEDDKVSRDFQLLGVAPEQLQALKARAQRPLPADDDHLVLPRHLWPPVQLAAALRTQLRLVQLPKDGGHLAQGLDYSAREATMRALGMPMRGPKAAELLAMFRVVERSMVDAFNNRPAAA